jgi:hypothetical protein
MVTDDNKVGYPLRAFFISMITSGKMSKYLADPIMLCCTCMASVYGTLIFWSVNIYQGNIIDVKLIGTWILTCVTCSFINGFLWAINELVRKH